MNKFPDSPPSPKRNSFEGFRPPHLPPPTNVSGDDETREKPKKKRSKGIQIGGDPTPSGPSQATLRIGDPTTQSAAGCSKPKSGKKPEPNAPKITRPCSECGKQFWSWKALFGHMRCHPERQWRGINPPPNFQRHGSSSVDHQGLGFGGVHMTEEDHEVATSLLMLANGSVSMETTQFLRCDHHGSPEPVDSVIGEASAANDAGTEGPSGSGLGLGLSSGSNYRFECSSCKKVFGSHQALGGHRASHKNVKGCFAMAVRNDDDGNDEDRNYEDDSNGNGNDRGKSKEIGEEKMGMELGHKCEICSRVFSSGQALGGHKRCHWEKGEYSSSLMLQQGGLFNNPGCSTSHARRDDGGYVLDLNLPPPVDIDSSSSSSSTSSSDLGMDLRLGF